MKLADPWISVVHRGLVLVGFGLLTLFGHDRSLKWFAPLMLFAAMSDGVLAVAAAARAAYVRERWAWLLVEGLAGLTGIVLIAVWPTAHFAELTWTLTGWAAITAMGAVAAAISLGSRVTRDWLLAAAGVVLLRFAVLGIGASRCGEFAIAFCSGAGVLIFAALFLARIVKVRLTSEAAAGNDFQLFAR
jgi:uncharacterized membrane protein HdeD (DUF308 family)